MKDLTKDETAEVLKKAMDGVLAFTDGTCPYCIPLGHVYVDDAVYLTVFPKGRKWEYFQKNSNVCFSAYYWNKENTECVSAVVDGRLERVNDIKSIENVVKANMEKSGIKTEGYFEKRLEYYKKSMDDPAGLKVLKIKSTGMHGLKLTKHG